MNPVQKEENFQSCNTNRCVQVVNNGLESGHAAAGSQSRPWSTGQPGAPHTAVTRAENGTRTAGGGEGGLPAKRDSRSGRGANGGAFGPDCLRPHRQSSGRGREPLLPAPIKRRPAARARHGAAELPHPSIEGEPRCGLKVRAGADSAGPRLPAPHCIAGATGTAGPSTAGSLQRRADIPAQARHAPPATAPREIPAPPRKKPGASQPAARSSARHHSPAPAPRCRSPTAAAFCSLWRGTASPAHRPTGAAAAHWLPPPSRARCLSGARAPIGLRRWGAPARPCGSRSSAPPPAPASPASPPAFVPPALCREPRTGTRSCRQPRAQSRAASSTASSLPRPVRPASAASH